MVPLKRRLCSYGRLFLKKWNYLKLSKWRIQNNLRLSQNILRKKLLRDKQWLKKSVLNKIVFLILKQSKSQTKQALINLKN